MDAEGVSAGGIVESASKAIRYGGRPGLFAWLGQDADPISTSGAIFDTPPLVMPRRVPDETTSAVYIHVRAKGTGTITATATQTTDTDSAAVASASWAWYPLGPISVQNESSTATATEGARANTPFGDSVAVAVTSGTLDVSSVYIYSAPQDVADHWTPHRLGTDAVLWLDPERLCEVAAGAVTTWTCPITGLSNDAVGDRPAFAGPSSTFGSRSVTTYDDTVPQYLEITGDDWDPTVDGLTVYWVGEWDATSGGSDGPLASTVDGSGGWTLYDDSANGLTFGVYDGTSTLRTALEGTANGTGPHVVRAGISTNAGSVVADVSVDAGLAGSIGFTGYTAVGNGPIRVFTDGNDFGTGTLATVFVVARYIAPGSDEDLAITASLTSRFGL